MNGEPQSPAEPGAAYAAHDLKAIAARWDARAAQWDAELANPECHLNEDDAYQRFLEFARQAVSARRLHCRQSGLIDVGCGTGIVLEKLSSHFAWSIGLDISGEMLRAAAEKKIPGARFTKGDCFCLPELCPPAGAVVSRGVLLSHYGAGDAGTLLRAARHTLLPGGFVLFDFLNAAARGRHEHEALGKTHFTGEEVLELARAALFRTAEILAEPERRVRLLLAGV